MADDRISYDFEWASGGKLAVTARNGQIRFADKCDPRSARSRTGLIQRLEQMFPSKDLGTFEQDLLEVMDRSAEPASAPSDDLPDPNAAGDYQVKQTPPSVVEDAMAMLRAEDLVQRVSDDIEAFGVVGEYGLAFTLYVLGTSRLLPKPLAAIVQGSSSSGKSHSIDKVAQLFPPEQTLLATDMTPNALYYVDKGELRHRLVVAGERSRVEDDDRAEATRALREMLSSGVLRKVLPQKTDEGMRTLVIENPGPIAFVESTTLAEVFEEDRNRALLLASDDSSEQTRAVVLAIAASYAGQRSQDADRIRERHRTAQRLLRRVHVRVPFAVSLAQRIPDDRPDARRVIGQALTAVQAVALLHQFQRVDNPQHGDTIDATVADYAVARELLVGPVGRALGDDLPEHVRSFAEWIRGATQPSESFRLKALRARPGCRWSESSIYSLAKPLQGLGYLVDAGTEGRSTLWRVSGSVPDPGSTWLPEADQLEVPDVQ